MRKHYIELNASQRLVYCFEKKASCFTKTMFWMERKNGNDWEVVETPTEDEYSELLSYIVYNYISKEGA